MKGSSDLIEETLDKFDNMKYITNRETGLSYEEVMDNLQFGNTMIANVHNGTHFVLAYDDAGDGENIKVMDPGFNVDQYPLSEIKRWVVYRI